MTIIEKAEKMYNGAAKLASEYRKEGDFVMARLLTNAFAELPYDSAARLHDILTK